MSNALTIYNQFDQIQKAAIALQTSGYFKDVTSQAQAIVKVMAGAELGLPPFASMTGIHIIQGKPTLGANVIATLVKNDPRYDYRVKVCNNDACVIEWYEGGKQVGESGFTMVEAKAAGLTGKDNWQKFPSDMLFARAITRGARRFAPGIFGGSPVYTPDELGADVDPEGYVDAQFVSTPETQPAQPAATIHDNPVTGVRPYAPDEVRIRLESRAAQHSQAGKLPSDKQIQLTAMLMRDELGDDQKRHIVTRYLTGHESLKDCGSMVIALLDWLKPNQDSGGAYTVDSMAGKELRAVYTEALKAQGQAELL